MDSPRTHTSFYEQHILGPDSPEVSPPVASQLQVPRNTNSLSIDPIVKHLGGSTTTLNGRGSKSPAALTPRLGGGGGLGYKTTGKIENATGKPSGQNLSHILQRRQNPEWPLQRNQGHQGGSQRLPRPTSEQQRIPMPSKLDYFYSLEDGLNWYPGMSHEELRPHRQNHNNQSHRRHGRSSKRNRHYSSKPSHNRRCSAECLGQGRVESPAMTQRLVAEKGGDGQYRTTLYVTPTPSNELDTMTASSELTSTLDRHTNHRSKKDRRWSKRMHAYSQDNVCQASFGENGAGEYNVFGSCHCVVDGGSLDRRKPHRRDPRHHELDDGSSSRVNGYQVRQPRVHQLLSPRSKDSRDPVNGFPPHRVEPRGMKDAMKPPPVHEAYKRQHVNQWVNIGTVGDRAAAFKARHPVDYDSDLSEQTESESLESGEVGDLDSNQVYGNTSAEQQQQQQQDSSTSTPTREVYLQPNKFHVVSQPPQNTPEWTERVIKIPSPTPRSTPRKSSNFVIDLNDAGSEPQRPMSSTFYQAQVEPEVPVRKVSIVRVGASAPVSARSPGNVTNGNHLSDDQVNQPATRVSGGAARRSTIIDLDRPITAPKPNMEEKMAAMLNRRSLSTTTGSAIRHMNSKISSHIISPTHLEAQVAIDRRYTPQPNSESPYYSNKIDGNARTDTPVPHVRNLAAYFTDLIKQQDTPRRFFPTTVSDGMNSNRHIDNSTPQSDVPFLLRDETTEEQERRLHAVDRLRNRSSTLPTVNYSRYSGGQPVIQSARRYEPSVPEEREIRTSTPPVKVKYITADLSRNSPTIVRYA